MDFSSVFARTAALIGEEALHTLQNKTVAVLGLGGVGGMCAEMVARSGVGTVILMDHDTVSLSNLNRQNFALTSTLGMSKTDAAVLRLKDAAPFCRLVPVESFYSAETRDVLFDLHPDFVIDAIDTVSAKLDLLAACRERRIPSIMCLGTGNRLDPSAFRIGTIEETAGCGCGLARVMRRECKKRGFSDVPVVYSTEIPRVVVTDTEHGRHSPASISFCPPVAGCLLASFAVQTLCKTE